MKINKSILTSALAVVFALSILIGTLFYANQYTISHMSTNNSSQGHFQNNGGPSNGNFNKPTN